MRETSSVFADEGQGGIFTDARNREEERKALKELGILNEHLLGLRPAKLKRLLEVLKVSLQGVNHEVRSVGIGLSFFFLIANLDPLLSEL
jgi:hypothetical protein